MLDRSGKPIQWINKKDPQLAKYCDQIVTFRAALNEPGPHLAGTAWKNASQQKHVLSPTAVVTLAPGRLSIPHLSDYQAAKYPRNFKPYIYPKTSLCNLNMHRM